MRAAIYARYSGDRQREASIDDQVRNCNRHAAREAFTIHHIYQDRAVSGAVAARHDYQAMLKDAVAGTFDVLLVDDLSRLSRDDYEMKGLLRKFAWQGLRVIGVSDGYDSAKRGHKIHAGFKGLMNEVFLDDLRERTHRGMTGQALKGYNCGGRTFGYRNVPVEDPSRRDAYGRAAIAAVRYEIDEAQATIVRQIHTWYADGYSYSWIAAELNRQRLPASRGGTWAVSAVKVVLENVMYEGKLVWNRRVWMKHPETGKRTYRKRPRDEWIETANPELRIVPESIIEAVRSRQHRNKGARPWAIAEAPAQRYLFSGLMVCAVCGGNFVLVANGRYGCAARKARGASVCTNGMTVSRKIVEVRLLERIKSQLMAPGHAERFARAAKAVLKSRASAASVDQVRKQFEAAERARRNILEAIRQGIVTASTKEALEQAESEVAALQRQAAQASEWTVTDALPGAIERYQEAVEQLEARLAGHVEPARAILKSLFGAGIRIHRRREYLEAEIPNHVPAILTKSLNFQVDLSGCGGGICTKSTFVPLTPAGRGSRRGQRATLP
ncbi:MAG: recombinase family protein [Phycisphaerales bacterium]